MKREDVERMLKLVEKLYDEIDKSPVEKGKGRPKRYPDLLILKLAILKEVYSLSYRKTLSLARSYFDEVPSLRVFHYRHVKLKDLVESVLERLRNEIGPTLKGT